MVHRLWLTAVAIHRLGVVEIDPSPHHCFARPTPVRSRLRARQESSPYPAGKDLATSSPTDFDGGWHVCQAVFPEPQYVAACRRVERRDCAHEALPRLQSASSWLVMEQLASGVCRVRSMRQATVLLM